MVDLKKAATGFIGGLAASAATGGVLVAGSQTLFPNDPTFASVGKLVGLVTLSFGSLFSFLLGVHALHDDEPAK